MTTLPFARSDRAWSGNVGFTSLIFRGGRIPSPPPIRYGRSVPAPDAPGPDATGLGDPSATPPAASPTAPWATDSAPVSGVIVAGASTGTGDGGSAGAAAGNDCDRPPAAGLRRLVVDGA